MKSMIVPLLAWNRYHRKGSITLEYDSVVPGIHLFVVSGMAIVCCNGFDGYPWAMSDAVRVARTGDTGQELKSRERNHSANLTLTS